MTHKKTGAEELDLHHRNLLNAIRKNELLHCDATLGDYGVVATAMGNISYRRRKYMRWDRAKQRAARVSLLCRLELRCGSNPPAVPGRPRLLGSGEPDIGPPAAVGQNRVIVCARLL